MKRALRSKVKANLENNSSEDATVDSLNLPNQKISRRTRTSAAMIGLAISMGASSLFVTRQSDQALAAEPVGNQNTASAIPAAGDTGVKLATTNQMGSQAVSNVSAPENPIPVVEPTAVSQVPGLGAKWLATSKNEQALSASSFTRTSAGDQNSVSLLQANKGQRIQSAIAKVQARTEAQAPVPTSYGITTGSVALEPTNTQTVSSLGTSDDANAQLKAQQEFAINRLQQKSDRLRDSLTKLRSQENEKSEAQPTATVGTTTQSQFATTNNLDSNTIPKPTVAEMPSSGVGIVPQTSKIYEVKPGDTLAAIASSNGTSVNEIVKANGLQNVNELKISQKLNIPVANTPINAAQVATNQVSVPSNVAIPTPARSVAVASNNTASNNTTIAPIVVPTPVATLEASVPSDSTPIDPTANGMGGETPPKVFAQMQQRNAKNKQEKQDRGLRSLQAEIERLRQKYRAQQSGNTVPTQANLNNVSVPVPTYIPGAVTVPSVPSVPVARPNNIAIPVPTVRQNNVAIPIPVPTPMAPNYSAQPVNPEWSARNARNNNNKLSVPPVPTTANASESLGNMRGTTVTPQLPPLAAVDRYLPRAIDENTPAPVAPGGAPGVGNTAFIWPAKGVLTSGYGWRWGRMHRGIDVANSVGTPVYAAAAGVIEKAGWNNGGYGNLVEVRHANGTMTRYGHNSRIIVQPGQQVNQGDIIALMGSTGFSTGPHTHFEIHPSGKGAVNPIAFLPARV